MKVSVLMTVFNGERYLAKAVNSVLNQTWRDFELICVDDGSTDASLEILRSFEILDRRIRIFSRPNTGIAGALNDGLAMAKGELIARMDADDMCFPSRLEEQVRYLDLHGEVVCLGCCAVVVDLEDEPMNVFRVPLSHEEIDGRHIIQGLGGGILHPGAMMRTAAVRALGGYRVEYQLAEDLDLWLRMAEAGRLANLGATLLQYRLNPAGLSHLNRAKQNERTNAAIAAARQRRCLTSLPPPRNSAIPTVVELLTDAVMNSRREGYWKAAQKYAWRLVQVKPITKFGWRVLAESTFRRLVPPQKPIPHGGLCN